MQEHIRQELIRSEGLRFPIVHPQYRHEVYAYARQSHLGYPDEGVDDEEVLGYGRNTLLPEAYCHKSNFFEMSNAYSLADIHVEQVSIAQISVEALPYSAGTDTAGRAGEDDVAHLERMLLAHEGNDLIDAV